MALAGRQVLPSDARGARPRLPSAAFGGGRHVAVARHASVAARSGKRGDAGPVGEFSELGGAKAAEQPAVSRRNLINLGASTMAFASCACCNPNVAKADGGAVFTYGDMSGPVAWGGLCSSAESQSPIDLPVAPYGGVAVQGYTARVNSKGWTFQYGNEQERCTVSNVGPGSMVVKFQGKTPYAFIDGKQLELLQFHFHTPSEHAFSGNRYPMEVHLVHKNVATGGLAVIGVMIQGGAEKSHPTVEAALSFAPSDKNFVTLLPKAIKAQLLLPASALSQHTAFIHYSGSLTTPPCSEPVDWFVMVDPIKVKDDQILRFQRYLSGGRGFSFNARPLMPINDRYLELEVA